MRPIPKLVTAASIALAFASLANAQEVQLTSAQRVEVSNACRSGLPLVPVESDLGFETGEYALPILGEGGEVSSAWILSEETLREISSCRLKIDDVASEDQTLASSAIS